jgi:hypothetical protein
MQIWHINNQLTHVTSSSISCHIIVCDKKTLK